MNAPAQKPTAVLRSQPEDFQVCELPAYEPSGSGEHLFVHVRKRGMTTFYAGKVLAEALGLSPKQVSSAGLKDRHALTEQWLSLPWPVAKPLPEVSELALPEELQVLQLAPHGNKLKTGHLRGNRFQLQLRGLEGQDLGAICEAYERLGREGVPNRFGPQRFGNDGKNVERALAWMRGEAKAPRDKKIRRLEFSALQSQLFHDFLEQRLADGTLHTPLVGDWLQKRPAGGAFLCEEPEVDLARYRAGELMILGPIFGSKMRKAQGQVGELERTIVRQTLGDNDLLQQHGRLGTGTRRPLVLWPEQLSAKPSGSTSVELSFVLPKGAYATTVVGAVCDYHDARARGLAGEAGK